MASATGDYVGTSYPNADGAYEISSLAAGSYKILFDDYTDRSVAQWYGGGADQNTATVVTVTAGQQLVGIDVTLAKGASISGRVSAPAGVDLSGVSVSVYSASSYSSSGWANVQEDGSYKISGLPAGSYKVQFNASNSGAFGQWYEGAAGFESATPVTLAADQDLTGINAALIKGASISGKVTAPAGVDLSNVGVLVHTAGQMSYSAYGQVTADGSYVVRGLAAGSYKLEFSANGSGAANQWHSGATSFETATPVAVATGQDMTGIDEALVKGASISGTATAPAGVDLGSVRVQLYRTDTSNNYAGSAQIQPDGSYTMGGLAAGSYKIQFSGPESGALEQWYAGGSSLETATAVTLTAGQDLAGVDATLVKGASISGHVTAPPGVELGYVAVRVHTAAQMSYSAYGRIESNGSYIVRGLPAGSYKVQFTGSYSGALEQWHAGASSFETAVPINLAEGQDLTGVDATLVKGATISGTVSAPAGVDLGSLSVSVENANGFNGFMPFSAQVGFDGSYTVRGLPAGTYKVEFGGYNSGTLTQWHAGASSSEAATPITVAAGEDVTGINATLVKGASISGSVTAPSGVDVSSVRVDVMQNEMMGFSRSTRVRADGGYTVSGLPAGTYRVRFSGEDSGALNQWHAGASSFESATPVILADGQDVTDVDATLVKGASISGVLTTPSGVDLNSLSVYVRTSDRSGSFYAPVGYDGSYSVRGLPAGTYKVQFSGNNAGTVSQWYVGASTFEAATPITLAAGQDLTGIGAAMTAGASISGKISASTGVDMSAVRAYVYGMGYDYAGSSSVAADGSYKVSGLAAGSYKVQFGGNNSGALEQWHGGGANFQSATAVVLADSQDLTGIDAALVKSASISGKVTAPDGITFSGVSVSVYTAGARSHAGHTWLAADGSYKVDGLREGSYKLQFNGGNSGALDAWHGGGETFEAAATVVLTAGQDLTGINGSLVQGAAISGKVTVPAGVDLGAVRVTATTDGNPFGMSAQVNADGTYKVRGLPAATYKVRFSGGGSGALDEWYDNVQTQAAAAPIVLTAGQDRTGVDATLAKGASISGKVTLPAGTFSYHGTVSLFKAADKSFVASTSLGSDGSYVLRGLEAGGYKLQFSTLFQGALAEWYDNAASIDTAATVTVTDGQSVTSVDATLINGATISGKITAPAGTNLGAADVYAFKGGSIDAASAVASVNAEGTYKLIGLEPGTYKLQFSGGQSGAIDKWFGGTTFESATPRTVVAEQNVTAVDLTVITGAAISGKVTGTAAYGYPLSVLDTTGNTVKSAQTDWAGNYSVVGLAAGSYKVAFNRSSGYSAEEAQYYQNKPESAGVGQAQAIPLTLGQSVQNINATLSAGGSITGSLLGKDGKVLANAYIQAYTTDGSLVTRGGMTDAAGKYTITGLTSGKYVLRVRSWADGDLYSGNTATEAAATPVTVVSGSSTPHELSWAAVKLVLTAPVPTVTGKTTVGSTLTAVPGTWGPAPVTLAYQWKAGGTAVTGATTSTYKPVAADLGKTLTVTVTGTKDGYMTESKTSVATATVMAVNPVLTAPTPKITGTAKVGSILTATSGTWGPAPVTLKYQWKANGIAITGATASTYRQAAADLGKTLTVTVTGTKAGYTTAAKTSAATAKVAIGTLTVPAVTITGTLRVGSTLTAAGTWGPAPVTMKYQWKANGIAITGATASTYKPASTVLGKTLTVTVAGSKAGYTSVAKTSAATAKIAAGILTAPVPGITGTAKVGNTLTATGTWGPAPVTLRYQWKANGIAITGATASTYKPAATVLGKTLTVTVTGAKAGYTTVAKTSAATARVAAGTLTAPVPSITGTAKVGSILTAVPGTWGPAPVTLKYQWKANGIAITGATASTYKPATTVRGKTLTVTVTGAKTGYTAVAKTSAATAKVV